ADFDNYRRRRDREAEEVRASGAEAVLKELLPIFDNMERALGSLPEGTPVPVREGIELIHRQMIDGMRRLGVEPIDAIGETFDPRLHEAVAAVETGEIEDQKIIDQFQRGYRYAGRLLRPSLVRVVMNAACPEGNEADRASGQAVEEKPWDE
ncbi:MAG: nucleotide exchange factor GrpE, partial [Vicinamibacteria bacterium]